MIGPTLRAYERNPGGSRWAKMTIEGAQEGGLVETVSYDQEVRR